MADYEIILASKCDQSEVVKAIKGKGFLEEQMEKRDRSIVLRNVCDDDLEKLKGIEGIFSIQSVHGR